jgi:hypothetical protein
MKSILIPKCFKRRIEVHLHHHAALARRIRGYICQGYMATNDLKLLIYRSEEQKSHRPSGFGAFLNTGAAHPACA